MSIESLFEMGEVSITSIGRIWKKDIVLFLTGIEIGEICFQGSVSTSYVFMGVPPLSFSGKTFLGEGFLIHKILIEDIPYGKSRFCLEEKRRSDSASDCS